MIGFVVVTHGRLADELIATAEQIVGNIEGIKAVSTTPSTSPEETRENISKVINSFEDVDGIIILTDLFGGTPSNISISFLEDKKVEVVTGVNLPMMIKISSVQKEMPLEELARYIRSYGKENISIAGELLKG